jgi:hypothetical protein
MMVRSSRFAVSKETYLQLSIAHWLLPFPVCRCPQDPVGRFTFADWILSIVHWLLPSAVCPQDPLGHFTFDVCRFTFGYWQLQIHVPNSNPNISIPSLIIGARNFYRPFVGNKELFFSNVPDFVEFIIYVPINFTYIICRFANKL